MGLTLFCVIVLFAVQGAPVESSRILVLIPVGTKSHTSGFEPLYFALGTRGHQVTIVSNSVPSKPIQNIRYIQNFKLEKVIELLANPYEARLKGKTLNAFASMHLYETVCKATYELPEVMALLKEDFDLIIINSFLSECSYGIASHFKKAKLMLFSTLPLLSWVSSIFGNPVIPSFTPLFVEAYSDRMTFPQRVRNFVKTIQYYYYRHYYHVPKMEAIYRSYIPNASTVAEVDKNIEFILINSHPIINYPRALLPNMIETSCIHCVDGKPLTKDLQEFIDGAGKEGFIYFSMGSFLQGSGIPEGFRLAIIKSFAKLKQRVIWKFETEKMDDLPPNVKLSKWLPQQDILAQPSIRLFITHGGLLSIQEAIYHGVPLLGIPLFGDQDGNLEQAESRGISLTQKFEEINEASVSQKINQILSDQNFKVNAKKVSLAFRDRLKSPLDTAIFWTEYLLRHNDSTTHLHSAGRDLNAFQYHSLDVIGTIVAIFVVTLYIIYKILKYILRCCKNFMPVFNSNTTSKKIKPKLL